MPTGTVTRHLPRCHHCGKRVEDGAPFIWADWHTYHWSCVNRIIDRWIYRWPPSGDADERSIATDER
jgi:hypothetical protein